MSEKYIDLTEEIWRADEGRTSFGSVSMVLAYLDERVKTAEKVIEMLNDTQVEEEA